MQFDPRKLTGLLIESVIDDAAFASLPQYFAHYANTASSQIQFHSADGAVAAASYGISDAILERYNTYYWKHDVWALEYQRLGIDTTVRLTATSTHINSAKRKSTTTSCGPKAISPDASALS